MDIERYYNNPETLAKITEHLKGRETSFLNKDGRIIRGIKCEYATYLKRNIDYYRLIDNKYNIYRSIAKYKDFPLFSWKKDIRHVQYGVWTGNEVYKKHIVGYDYYIDFDNKDDDDSFVRQEVLETSQYLSSLNIKHEIISSGRGYHIHSLTPLKEQTPEYAKNFTKLLVERLNLVTPDMSIYKWQSLIKCPYSVDFKTKRVCTIIRSDMFKEWKRD